MVIDEGIGKKVARERLGGERGGRFLFRGWDLLEAWISQLYIASKSLGLQSRKPCRIESRTVLMISPVRRPSCSREVASSSEDSATVTSSRKTAMPCTGSWQSGP